MSMAKLAGRLISGAVLGAGIFTVTLKGSRFSHRGFDVVLPVLSVTLIQ